MKHISRKQYIKKLFDDIRHPHKQPSKAAIKKLTHARRVEEQQLERFYQKNLDRSFFARLRDFFGF